MQQRDDATRTSAGWRRSSPTTTGDQWLPSVDGPVVFASGSLAKTISAAAWEFFGALRHGDDYVAALVPLLDVRVGLDDLPQRIAPVDDRPDLPGLDEFFEEDKVLGTPAPRTRVLVDVE